MEVLIGSAEENFAELIVMKTKGGLLYPSRQVFVICKRCEKLFRSALAQSGGKHIMAKFSIASLTNDLMKHLSVKQYLQNMRCTCLIMMLRIII